MRNLEFPSVFTNKRCQIRIEIGITLVTSSGIFSLFHLAHHCAFSSLAGPAAMKKFIAFAYENSLKTPTGLVHGRRLIVLGHQHGDLDFMWKEGSIYLNTWLWKRDWKQDSASLSWT